MMATFCHLSCLGYPAGQGKKAKKKLTAPNISLTLDRSEGSLLSDELDESTELDLDGIDTPSDNSNEFEWEGKKCLSFQFSRIRGLKSRFSVQFQRCRLPFSAPGLICMSSRVAMVLLRLSPPTVVKMCLIVLCFHTAAFLFIWEEMFPLSVWKQAAGQLQVSLFLAVRSLGISLLLGWGFLSFQHMLINQIYSLSAVITDEACKIHFHLFAIIIFIIKLELICQ